jgi:hypothetical protein
MRLPGINRARLDIRLSIQVSSLSPLSLAFSLGDADEALCRHGAPQNTKREDLRHSTSAELVQRGPEVIEDDAVGETLEDESKFPERVDDAYGDHGGDGEDVDNDADHAQAHAEKQDAEPRRDLDDLDEAQLVAELDVPEEIDDGEYPPGIANN